MNEDCCEPLMEPAALTTHCTKCDVMTSLSDFGSINHPTVTVTLHRESLVTHGKKCEHASRHLGLKIPYISTHRTLDLTRSYLIFADLQINRFLEAFHVTWLGKTHADTTCSYSTSWEALIFNTFGPYISLQLGSNLQLSWFWQLFKSVCIFRQLLSHTSLLLIY